MRIAVAFLSLIIMGSTSLYSKSVKDLDEETQQNEEEVKERRDIHKPGQMSQGYGHEDDEKQQDVDGKDPDDYLDDDGVLDGKDADMDLRGYPIQ